MKRFLAVLILSAIIISVLSTCAKSSYQIETEDDALDFLGGNMVVAVGMNIWNYPSKRGGSAASDRELDRYADAEKTFNFKFEYLQQIEPSTHFLAAALTGGMQSDLLFCDNRQLYQAYLINTLLPIENVVDDAESDKWKSPANNAKALYGGKMYGIFPNYWESAPSILGMINLNMDILEEYNIESPYEFIETGDWDWKNFRAFLQKTAFKDGEKEWFGMALGINGVGVACIFPFVLSNGGSFLKESDGRYILNINSPEAMEAYDYIADLGVNGLITEVPNSDPAYANGEKWMLASGSPSSSTEFNMAQIRYPYGPSGNKDTVSTIALGFYMWSFPIFSAYNEDEIGEVAEFLFDPLSDIYPNGWKDSLEDKIFTYHSEFEYYLKGVEEAEYIDMHILSDSFWLLSNTMFDISQGTQSPTNAIESIFDVINEEINEKYNGQ